MKWMNFNGINIWRLNRTFKSLAFSKGTLEEKIKNDILTLPLPFKKERVLTAQDTKERILRTIEELEGFEMFKLCMLEDCKLTYKEQITQFGVFRWLEIPINKSALTYDRFGEMKN